MKEIKVLIAEDEPPIGRFVKKITEELPGFSVCGVCRSGEEGLELIKKERPDVLITDIRMPGMSGLELIRSGRQILQEMYAIVISGYRMFEYAKEAIELETAAYILKPIDPEELQGKLLTVKKAWGKRSLRKQQEELQLAFRRREEALFTNVLSCRNVRILAVYYGNEQEEICLLGTGTRQQIFWLLYKNWVFFLQDEEEGRETLESVIRKIMVRPGRRRTCACVMIPAMPVREGLIEDLRKLYREVLRRVIIPGRTVQMVLAAEGAGLEEQRPIPDETLKNQLRIDIEARDLKNFQRHFFELFALWEKNQACIAHIRGWMHELTALLKKNNILRAESIPFNEGLDEIVWQGDSFSEIRDGLWKEMEEVFLEVRSEAEGLKKDEKMLFEQICRLMENNPDKNNSLQEICDRFHVSQPYVRKIFRIYTGKTYKEYQLEWKIALARRLMDGNPSMLVREVAEKIGFEQLYFGTVFSKYTGMTPSQYKAKRMAEINQL